MTENAMSAFQTVNQVIIHTCWVLMNTSDPLLCTRMCQLGSWEEYWCKDKVGRTLSEQDGGWWSLNSLPSSSLWRILLLTFYSLNRVITRSLYLSISTIPITGQIEGPRIGVQILIEHIPGSHNMMADRLHIETIFQNEHSISTPFNRCKLVLMRATCS